MDIETIIAEYFRTKRYRERTRTVVGCTLRLFLKWSKCTNTTELNRLDGHIVNEYLRYQSTKLKGSTLYEYKQRLKDFYQYLNNEGWLSEPYKKSFEIPIAVEHNVKQPISEEEMSIILDSIDRYERRGKRNYAFLLLGMRTGLRGTDVINLKLTDIDWINGEIRIQQAKTGTPLCLPLTKDVGEALKDYILNGRSASDSKSVFLKVKQPFGAYKNLCASSNIMSRICTQSGLPSRGFHELRRLIGRNMVISGIPVTTVAQVLGHNELSSTKPYISLDTLHLKECALGLTNIEPARQLYDKI